MTVWVASSVSLLKLQRSRLITVIEVFMGHWIIGTHSRRIGLGYLANDFCRSFWDEEEYETIHHVLYTCPALGRMNCHVWILTVWVASSATLLKLQRSSLSTIIGVITGHCIIGPHARRIGLVYLANDFCRSCGDDKKNEIIFRLLCTCPAIGRRRKAYLSAYYMEHLDGLSCMDIDSLSRFI